MLSVGNVYLDLCPHELRNRNSLRSKTMYPIEYIFLLFRVRCPPNNPSLGHMKFSHISPVYSQIIKG